MNLVFAMMLSGIVIIIVDITFYPSSLPKVIDSNNSYMIATQSYVFYLTLFFGIGIIAFGIRKITTSKFLKYNNNISNNNNIHGNKNRSYLHSLFELVTTIIANIAYMDSKSKKQFSILFWSTTIGYGLFFSITSGILIYRAGGLSSYENDMIIAIPSVTIISYGPAGYVPTLAITLTENIGLLVIPINLIVMLVVSILVGFNVMLSMYAFKNKPKKKTLSGLGLIGAATGLFTACPTCASLFVFSTTLGSFASAIATFTATFYSLFVAITIPLLLVAPIITAIGMRRMQSSANTVCTR